MKPLHPASLPDSELLLSCQVERKRRSGPGGQHRNKVETGIVLVHVPTGVLSQATERRTQSENKKNALFRLRMNLALSVRMPWNSDRTASDLIRDAVEKGRIALNEKNRNFPAVLAETLDCLVASGGDFQPAVKTFGVTASQLVKLLKREPAAFEMINRIRHQNGMNRLL